MTLGVLIVVIVVTATISVLSTYVLCEMEHRNLTFRMLLVSLLIGDKLEDLTDKLEQIEISLKRTEELIGNDNLAHQYVYHSLFKVERLLDTWGDNKCTK